MKRLMAGILLVTGTSVGGGMIVLPVIAGKYGYLSAAITLALIWLINSVLAFFYFEACTYLPPKANYISISKKLLGKRWQWVLWALSLIFLYTMLTAYISGLTQVLSLLLGTNGVFIPGPIINCLVTVIFALPLLLGFDVIDRVNRSFVAIMAGAFIVLMATLAPYLKFEYLAHGNLQLPLSAFPVVYTSFGFLIIIPSLRHVLKDNIRHIKIAILAGSLVPLLMYILWTTFVMGAIPLYGEHGLANIATHAEPAKNIINTLILRTNNGAINLFIYVFTLFSIASSLVGIGLALFDFLADGFNLDTERAGGRYKTLALTFIPPLFISLTYERLYVLGMAYAGFISTLLLGFLPVVMSWRARNVLKLKSKYKMPANNWLFFAAGAFALTLMLIELKGLYSLPH